MGAPLTTKALALARTCTRFAYSRGGCCAGDDDDGGGDDDVYSLSLAEFCYMYVFFGVAQKVVVFSFFQFIIFTHTGALYCSL